MRWLSVGSLLLAFILTGCVSKSQANAQAHAAYLEGQRQAMAQKIQGPTVYIVGNVKNPFVPWTADLTLTKAVIAADYLGLEDRGRIARGAWADLVVFDRELALTATYVEGESIVEYA